DWPELALELGADGVHLGQNDLPLARARAIVGPKLAIGVSTHNLAQARAAAAGGADLIGFGPVFATTSKPDADAVVGTAALREVCVALNLPVVAIGGIDADNVASVVASGARMAASISAICAAADPRVATRDLARNFGPD